jgi:hypothetical protein
MTEPESGKNVMEHPVDERKIAPEVPSLSATLQHKPERRASASLKGDTYESELINKLS